MSKHFSREALAAQAELRAQVLHPPAVDRTFEIPTALYATTGALYLGFVGVMAVGFSNPGLMIPLAICAVFIAMFFAVPALWVRMEPGSRIRSLGWDHFRHRGIATHTGRLSAGEAAAQMLVLPVLIFVWAMICVTIAALV